MEQSPSLRSRQLFNYSRISEHFMETEGSLPYSQEPYTGGSKALNILNFGTRLRQAVSITLVPICPLV
jgi:hypothetical protein